MSSRLEGTKFDSNIQAMIAVASLAQLLYGLQYKV